MTLQISGLMVPKVRAVKGQKFSKTAFSYSAVKGVLSLSSAEVKFSFHVCLY